jgi:5-methylcytosine-specific restriction endonuclease McrA
MIPVSRGGDNSLENLGITCKAANQAKGDLTVEEFLKLCADVLTYNGFKVEKIDIG